MNVVARCFLLLGWTVTAVPAAAQFEAPLPKEAVVPSPRAAAGAVSESPPAFLPPISPPPPQPCFGSSKAFHQRPLGRFLTNLSKPLSLATGGLIPAHHSDVPCPAELAWLTHPDNLTVSPAEAIAAKIKAIEARAWLRRDAVRYLGTVDCHYFPEAEIALVKALREDTNECVRFEAARALGKGCCCTYLTAAALLLTVTGQCTDGNPIETSPRVRAAALDALNVCVSRLSMTELVQEAPLQQPPEAGVPARLENDAAEGFRPMPQLSPSAANKGSAPAIQLTAYYSRYVSGASHRSLMQEAGRALAEAAGTYRTKTNRSHSGRGLLQLWNSAFQTGPAREEIPYEEEALAVPADRRGRARKSKKPEKKTPSNNTKRNQIRASVTFEAAKKATAEKKHRPTDPLIERIMRKKKPPLQPNQIKTPPKRKRRAGADVKPVPWPVAKAPAAGSRQKPHSPKPVASPVAWPAPNPTTRRRPTILPRRSLQPTQIQLHGSSALIHPAVQ